MRRHKIIANPSEGGRGGARAIRRIQRLLTQCGLDLDIVRTKHPWHGAELAKQAAAEGYDVVVAAGGDGTSNEVINGLMEAKQAGKHASAMGVLSVGRGNDFAHAVGVLYDLEQACRVLPDDHRRMIDVGWVVGGISPEGRYFGNCVGVGLDAIGTIEAAKLPRLGGFLCGEVKPMCPPSARGWRC